MWAFSTCSSVVMAQGLSCSVACRIFPDQGSNLCPLYWQADSLPLDHQGSLRLTFPSVEPVKEMALTYMGGYHPIRWGLESNRKAEEGWICSLFNLGYHFLPLDIGIPGSQTWDSDWDWHHGLPWFWNCITGFPGPPLYRWHFGRLLGLYNCLNHPLITNFSLCLYIFYWLCFPM